MQIEHLPLDQITPAVNNSRTHSPEQVGQIAASIKEFGFTNPILVDEAHVIIAGHGRKLGAQNLGMPTAPCVILSGLSDAQKRAYLIADNQLPLNAGWNLTVLKNELSELQALDFDLDIIGFDSAFLDNLFQDVLPPEVNADAVPDVAEPVTVEGDMWLMGGHRAMCGDSLSVDAVAKLCGDERARLLHADPPYGMGKQAAGVQNDNLYREKLDAFQMEWWQTYRTFLHDNAAAYMWGNAPDLWRLWYAGGLADSEELALRNEIVWDKQTVAGMASALLTQYPEATERCLYFQLGDQFTGSVNADKYWSGWEAIRAPLEAQAIAARLTPKLCREITGAQMYSHWFSKSQWAVIPEEHYAKLAEALPEFFTEPYASIRQAYAERKAEYAAYLSDERRGVRAYFDNAHEPMRDVWTFPRVVGEERHGHATPKPVAMMERIMRTSLPRGGLCLEPFGGTGSTLIGAERTGRRCFTMELTPKYVDIIVRRWQDLTGEQAIHADTGQTFNTHAAS